MASGGGGFSLAFTGKKLQRRVEVQDKAEGARKETVTGFGKDGLQTDGPQQQQGKGALVIPKLENTYRTGTGKFKPSYIPEAADKVDAEGIDKFEVAEQEQAAPVTYGLQQRQRPQASGEGDANGAAGAPPPAAETEAEVLKRDLAELPPEAPLEAYEAMPVERFGEALLRGMGWQEGRSIGRGAKAEVVAKELVRRPSRLGLGATPVPETHQKKYIKPGESRDKKDMVYVDSEGHIKSSKPVDAKLVERKKEGVHPGKVMRVVDGRHSGLLCEVVALEPKEEGRSERARVRLLPSHEMVTVRCKELGEKGEKGDKGREKERERERERPSSRGSGGEREAAQQRGASSRDYHKREREGGEGEGAHDKRQRGGSSGAAGLPPRAPPKQQQPQEEEEEEGTPWLVPNIRVKVIDKRVKGGKLYLKKGVIVDVSQPTVCDVHFPDIRETVQGLRQSQLETVVPSQEGAPVLVLLGRQRGQRGRLLKRNTDTGLAAVLLTSEHSLHKLSLDEVAEYVGHGGDDD